MPAAPAVDILSPISTVLRSLAVAEDVAARIPSGDDLIGAVRTFGHLRKLILRSLVEERQFLSCQARFPPQRQRVSTSCA